MARDGRRDVLLAHGALVLAGVLFGTTFVVVKRAVADVGPVPFLAVRFLVGALVLAPFERRRPTGGWKAGAVCGAALGTGYVLQTIGLQHTTASVSAFVTYLLVVLVPLLAAVVLHQRPPPATVLGVVLATAGLVLLTGAGAGFGLGEALTLGCAIAFAAHVLLLAELAPRHDPLRLNMVQLAVVGGACLVPGFFLGGYRFSAGAWLAAIYTGVAVSAVALGLQVWAQRRVGPSRASLVLMIEPVAAAVLGYAFGERLGVAGAAGAGLILGGIAVSEVVALRRLPPLPEAGQPLDPGDVPDDTEPNLTLTSSLRAPKEPHG